MSELSPREIELVALGAALGSNCVPCIEYHIPQARKAGLSDQEIGAAVRLADRVRQVPARAVLEKAQILLALAAGEHSEPRSSHDCACGTREPSAGSLPGTGDTIDAMAATMKRMMSACGHGAAPDNGGSASSCAGGAPAPQADRRCC